MLRKEYLTPEVETISLQTIQETLQASSASGQGSGSNLGNPIVIGEIGGF